jgi:hypothetical protein
MKTPILCRAGQSSTGDFWTSGIHSGVVVSVNLEEGTFNIANAHVSMDSTVEGAVTIDSYYADRIAVRITDTRVRLVPGTISFRPYLYPGFK